MKRLKKAKFVVKAEKGTGQSPPPDVEVLEISSSSPPSNRTWSRRKPTAKSRAQIESSDDNDDNAPLIPLKRSKTKVTQEVLELSSDREENGEWEDVQGDGEDIVGNEKDVEGEVEDAAEPSDSDPDSLLAADPDDGEYDELDEMPWYDKKSPKKAQKAPPKGKGKVKQMEVDIKRQGQKVKVVIPIPPSHPKVAQLTMPVTKPSMSNTALSHPMLMKTGAAQPPPDAERALLGPPSIAILDETCVLHVVQLFWSRGHLPSARVLGLHERAPPLYGRVSSFRPTRLPCHLSAARALAQATCRQHRPPSPHHPRCGVGRPSPRAHPRHLDSR
jgi:hypothetical protein